ncbi:prosaposin [Cylas formicarius]|uniref:prosaposin n=1 Tax=Cylas formicarius TaxID=197179 RepID=UPI0029589EFB|nr:prosaposin [Cylas formicarius]
MKGLLLVVASLFALSSGVFVPPRPGHRTHHLLGEKECTYGPSFWCQNLTSAAGCRATKHCIQTVWIHKRLPPDTTSICDTCKDMVKQARDQLESNETQELIKEVFEGSCDLLKLKPIVVECDKIADEYIPDLIDTLSSEMNPQVVCSVAGLCNSATVRRLLAEAGELKDDKCDSCNEAMEVVVRKFEAANKDDVLYAALKACRKLGSYTDACSNLVVEHFDDAYAYLRSHLNAKDACFLSGQCFRNFHRHDVQITTKSKIGYVAIGSDEMVCDFCKQMVDHVREELVANTTEIEFKKVLVGLCKQTGSFATECVNYVEQYYGEVYDFIVHELNPVEVCDLVGLCGKKGAAGGYVAPLLTPENARKVVSVGLSKNVQRPEDMQLPIELVAPPHTQVVYNRELCAFCEYLLHYVQEEITSPATEAEIKSVLDKACERLPPSVNETCVNFVSTYEPALVAILAQEIDPSQVCPLMKVCPASDVAKDVDVFIEKARSSSECPLCLYVVTELESIVADKKSVDEIEAALKKVCHRLPATLKVTCDAFVDTYGQKVVESILADLKPQEVCVYLKLCTDDVPVRVEMTGGDIETNVIPDDTVDGMAVADKRVGGIECILCEYVMKNIEDALQDKTTDDDIKIVVKTVCAFFPETTRSECDRFIDQYADAIIALLEEAVEPAQVCRMMMLCAKPKRPFDSVKAEIVECAVCEATVTAMDKILSNPKVDHDIEHVLEKACRALPKLYKSRCAILIEDYGNVLFDMLHRYANKQLICKKVGYCKSASYRLVGLI